MSFSILISVYKNENPLYLIQALNSISINQIQKPNEIIIIKDGELPEILNSTLEKFQKNSTIKVIIEGYKENKGLGFALNYGLKFCTNELIFRMDTDDIAIPERFKIQTELFENNKEIAIIGSIIEEFNEVPGDLKKIRKVPISSEKINKNKLIKNPFNHMTIGFKKSIILEVGGYKDLKGYEDYYLWLRVLKNYKGLNINIPLVYARVGNNMLSRRQGFDFFKKEFQFQLRILNEKLQTKSDFLKNIIFRALPRLLPKPFLKFIYYKFLREDSQ